MEVVVTTGAINRAKLQSNHHHQQTNTQFFYRPDALPVAQPTVSKHWREKISHSMDLLTLSSPGGLPTLSLTTSSCWLPWGRVAMPLISPLMPVPQIWPQNIKYIIVQKMLWSGGIGLVIKTPFYCQVMSMNKLFMEMSHAHRMEMCTKPMLHPTQWLTRTSSFLSRLALSRSFLLSCSISRRICLFGASRVSYFSHQTKDLHVQ